MSQIIVRLTLHKGAKMRGIYRAKFLARNRDDNPRSAS